MGAGGWGEMLRGGQAQPGQASCGGWATPLQKGAEWATEGDRPNHSEVRGTWQDETARKGRLGAAAYQRLSLVTKSTASALIFPTLQPHRVSPGGHCTLYFWTPFGHCLSLKNYKSHEAVLLIGPPP